RFLVFCAGRADTWCADALHVPFRQRSDGVLAERLRLEFSPKQQPHHASWQLVSQQYADVEQWNELSERHQSDGQRLLQSEAPLILKRSPARLREQYFAGALRWS